MARFVPDSLDILWINIADTPPIFSNQNWAFKTWIWFGSAGCRQSQDPNPLASGLSAAPSTTQINEKNKAGQSGTVRKTNKNKYPRQALVFYAKCHMAVCHAPFRRSDGRRCLFMHIKMATINANKRTTITNINMEIHTHRRPTKAAVKNVANVSKIKIRIHNKDTITLTEWVFASFVYVGVGVCLCICKTKTFDIIKWNVIVKKVTCILKQTKLSH